MDDFTFILNPFDRVKYDKQIPFVRFSDQLKLSKFMRSFFLLRHNIKLWPMAYFKLIEQHSGSIIIHLISLTEKYQKFFSTFKWNIKMCQISLIMRQNIKNHIQILLSRLRFKFIDFFLNSNILIERGNWGSECTNKSSKKTTFLLLFLLLLLLRFSLEFQLNLLFLSIENFSSSIINHLCYPVFPLWDFSPNPMRVKKVREINLL